MSSDKPAQSGLVDMSDIGFYNSGSAPTFNVAELQSYAGSFSEIVLNLRWSDLEPSPGVFVTSSITNAISAVENFNSANGSDIGVKLRIWGGYVAPDWAQNIDGPPITVVGHGTPNVSGTLAVGRFWTADYIDAWTGLQANLAQQFGGNSIIRGISQTAGAAATDEPFVPLGDEDGVNQPALLEAGGYTDAAEILTLRAAIADYSAWSTTPLDYTLNLFHYFDSGKAVPDQTFPLAVLQQARNSTRLVQTGNHAASPSLAGNANGFIYYQMAADAALDPSVAAGSFQTQSPEKLGSYANWPAAVGTAVAAHAGDLELWDGTAGFPGLPPAIVQSLAETLATGIAPTTDAPADGSALGFIAPASVGATSGTAAFTGIDAVLLASSVAQNFYAVRVTLTSLDGGTLSVIDPVGIVQSQTSGTTIELSGPLALVNIVLASLTDNVAPAGDRVQFVATDLDGNRSVRTVGVVAASGAVGSGGGGGGSGFAGAIGSSGILLVGGTDASLSASSLAIGPAGDYSVLLAALAPGAYSNARLVVSGAVEIQSGGTGHFTGLLSGGSIVVDSGGTLAGGGILAMASGGVISNDGVVEATADTTLGRQRLVVSNGLAGTGTLLIDPGATVVLAGAVSPDQTIAFASNTIDQFANDPYTPSTLVLADPQSMQATISGARYADQLVLDGVSATGATYSGGILTVVSSGGSLTFALPGLAGGLTPLATIASGGNQTTISFVASTTSDARPSASAPATVRGGVGVPVLVPGIVIETPQLATPSADTTVVVTLVTSGGTLSAGDNNGSTTITSADSHHLSLSGTQASVERSLQTFTYTGASTGSDVLSITVSDFAGSSLNSAATTISVAAASQQFDWIATSGGDFASPGNWSPAGGPPGGIDVAAFGSGTSIVSGGGAVGEILVSGTTTFTGHVTAQGLGGSSLLVDGGGALTLAGGAVLTADEGATVGGAGDGLLVLMGGALELSGASGTTALVLGEQAGGSGTVIDLESIATEGQVIVGQAGTGVLDLYGIAATVTDGDAVLGLSAGAVGSGVVDGGFWATSGQLAVGAAGTGTLLIDGRQGGVAGQVTAYGAVIGSEPGGQGHVTLDGGEMLIANALSSSNILVVGSGGSGSLQIDNGAEVAVGVASAILNHSTTVSSTGQLVVGAVAGGGGLVGIGSQGALLVYGDGIVGAGGGSGVVSVGGSGTDHALFALLGTLEIGSTGRIALSGDDSLVRASTFQISSGGVVSGTGTLAGDAGGNGTVILADIDNDGAITAVGGNLLVYGEVTGSGTLAMGSGATMTLQAAVGSAQTLDFSADNGTAVLNDVRAFSGTIADFGSDDVLDLASIDATGATWSGGTLTLDASGGPIQLAVSGSYASNAFMLQSDGHGGTDLVLAPTGSGFVAPGETRVVSSGQSSAGLVVLPGGRLAVESGGSADDTMVRGGGTLVLSGGALVTDTTLDPGSVEDIAAGYVLNGFTISSGITLDVQSGGLASGTTVLSGGTLNVFSGGTASGIVTSSGGTVLSGLGGGQTLVISSGQSSNGITLISGGIETVLSGGTAIHTLVSSGGIENVLGQTSGSIVVDGGTQYVSSGGVASGTVLSSGSQQLVSSGGLAGGAIVRSGGLQNVLAGGAARATVVSVGGLEVVRGLAGGAAVSSGGTLTVLSAGIASGTIIEQGGFELAAGGGTALATSISSGGLLIVDSGSVASGTVVSSGGALVLTSGASATSTVFQSGATLQLTSGYAGSGISVTQGLTLEVGPGATVTSTSVMNFASAEAFDGAVASATRVQGGGTMLVGFGGTTRHDVLMGSGPVAPAMEVVALGGIASGPVVSNTGLLLVQSGGIAYDVVVDKRGAAGSPGFAVLSGGVINGARILAGGIGTLSGGSANGIIVTTRGVLSITSDAAALASGGGVNSASVIEDGGRLQVLSGFDFDTTVLGRGEETVSAHGAALRTILSGGAQMFILSGGTGHVMTVSSGAAIRVTGGESFSATVSSGGKILLSSGIDLSATILRGGLEIVYAGGRILSGALVGGQTIVSSGGTADDTVIRQAGALTVRGGVASGTVLSDGKAVASSGGSITDMTVWSHGQAIVSSGARTQDVTIHQGASIAVWGGVTSDTVVSGGHERIFAGGSAVGTLVTASGREIVLSGGTIVGTTLGSGGQTLVSSGGAIVGATLSGGRLEILSGGTAGSSTIMISSGTLKLDDSQNFNGYISGLATAAQVVDLVDIDFATVTLVYSGTTVSGVLTAQDAASHVAQVHLIGNYINAHFTSANDGHGGTLVTDPPVSSGQSYVISH